MNYGLVLEGGAMRGIYTAGVLDVFMEHGIETNGVVGVSAGVLYGCSYVSKQIKRSIRYTYKYRSDKHFMGLYSLLHTGNIVGEDFCFHQIPETLDPFDNEAFKNSDIKFYATCTNVETGKAEYIHCTDLFTQIDYARASSSMPFVSKIVEIDGKKYLDGGVADSIPVQASKNLGYEKNIVVLTRPRDYCKPPTNPKPAKIVYKKYPEFCKAIENRHINYNNTLLELEKLEKNGEVFVIAPSVDLHIGRMEKKRDRILAMYRLGRKDALRSLQELTQFMKTE
ncbi:Patatin-like phospholipase [Lachnospiraceae bacterium TWA4]|nr:Patatin-like phospholipase [Lachnospiraceae bacterium TWA4]